MYMLCVCIIKFSFIPFHLYSLFFLFIFLCSQPVLRVCSLLNGVYGPLFFILLLRSLCIRAFDFLTILFCTLTHTQMVQIITKAMPFAVFPFNSKKSWNKSGNERKQANLKMKSQKWEHNYENIFRPIGPLWTDFQHSLANFQVSTSCPIFLFRYFFKPTVLWCLYFYILVIVLRFYFRSCIHLQRCSDFCLTKFNSADPVLDFWYAFLGPFRCAIRLRSPFSSLFLSLSLSCPNQTIVARERKLCFMAVHWFY